MKKQLLIFGGSGHAKDVIHIARSMGYSEFKIVTTDGTCHIAGLQGTKESEFQPKHYEEWDCIAAIGNNAHRRRFIEHYASLRFVSLYSPHADISESAQIGAGCFIGSHAYIGPEVKLEDGCIINTQSIVGHDSVIGAFAHIGPQVCVAGNVSIGENVFIGAGAKINNGSPGTPLKISANVHFGMGSLVTDSIKRENIRLIPKPNYIAVKSPEA